MVGIRLGRPGWLAALCVVMLIHGCVRCQQEQKQTQEAATPEPQKRLVEVPQVVGRKYIVNLTESETEKITAQPTILLLGAKYDPDTRHYMPDFYILAHWIHRDPQYTGPKWQVAYYDVPKLQHKRDELMKRFDVYTLPQIIVVQNGKFWVYAGEKNREKLMEFVETKLDESTATALPDHVSDIKDHLRSIWREIFKAFEITAKENPEVINQIKIASIVLFGVFILLLLYAVLGKKETTADKKEN